MRCGPKLAKEFFQFLEAAGQSLVRFREFAPTRALPLGTIVQCDAAMESSMSKLYFAGLALYEGRCSLFGFCFAETSSGSELPRAHERTGR